MRKEAVGIAVNGRDVKIAHLYREKNMLFVDYLESSTLISDIDAERRKKSLESDEPTIIDEGDDVFNMEKPQLRDAPLEQNKSAQQNTDILYSLLRKFSSRKIKVAFNVSATRVSYQDLDTHLDYNKNAFKGSLRNKIDQWKKGFNALDNVSVITRKDGTLCNIISDTEHPPLVIILEQINAFYRGTLFLSLMDPNEISLVNLVRCSYSFLGTSEITIIVQMESEFSRIIFMRGEDLLTVSPMITENFSPDMIHIIYSKIIYELDNNNISKVSNILLAGKASTYSAKTFFEKKFPRIEVGFIISQPLAENLSTQFSREVLSEYAIPIALAWKLVEPKNKNFIQTNLLSSQVIDRQKVLKLSLSSYVLLFLLGISAFIFSWRITAKKFEIKSYIKRNTILEARIQNSEETVKLVQDTEDQIEILKKRLALSDSLSAGSDRLLTFLEVLNQSILESNSAWIDEIQNTKEGLLVRGSAQKRASVPELSRALAGAKIKKLTRDEYGASKVYAFEMEVNWNNRIFESRFDKKPDSEIPPIDETGTLKTQLVDNIKAGEARNTTLNQNSSFNEYLADNNTQANVITKSQSNPETAANLTINNPVSNTPENKSGFNNNHIEHNEQFSNNAMEQSYTQHTQSINSGNGSGSFTIRISAHAINLTARKEVEFYRAHGFDTQIVQSRGNSREIPYWVCYGDFSTYNEAEQHLNEINNAIPRKYKIVDISENENRHLLASNSIKNQNNQIRNTVSQDAGFSASTSYQQESNQTYQGDNGTSIVNDANTDYGSSVNSSKHFTIRLSAHATKLTARKDIELYGTKGYEAYVMNSLSSNREIPYWVCVGDYASYDEALMTIRELSETIPGSYSIISLNK